MDKLSGYLTNVIPTSSFLLLWCASAVRSSLSESRKQKKLIDFNEPTNGQDNGCNLNKTH